jgi:peptidoglycan/xylan/chitin deacetylase (PgdA/CDA1 family)
MSSGNPKIVVPCLAYHRLHDGAAPSQGYLKAFSMDVGIFRDQLAALESAGYTACHLTDLLMWRRGSSKPPEHPIFITFDDGWASNLLLAAPELHRYHMPWTIFVVADLRSEIFEEGGGLDRALTPDEITQLVAAGVVIESHGLTHHPLTELTKDELDWELHESRTRLEALTQQPVAWIAAPYGLANSRVIHAVREAGYHGLACGAFGVNTITQEPLIRLRRIAARPSWSGEQLLQMLSPGTLKRTARMGNFKRKIRLMLGHRWSTRLRRLIRSKV